MRKADLVRFYNKFVTEIGKQSLYIGQQNSLDKRIVPIEKHFNNIVNDNEINLNKEQLQFIKDFIIIEKRREYNLYKGVVYVSLVYLYEADIEFRKLIKENYMESNNLQWLIDSIQKIMLEVHSIITTELNVEKDNRNEKKLYIDEELVRKYSPHEFICYFNVIITTIVEKYEDFYKEEIDKQRKIMKMYDNIITSLPTNRKSEVLKLINVAIDQILIDERESLRKDLEENICKMDKKNIPNIVSDLQLFNHEYKYEHTLLSLNENTLFKEFLEVIMSQDWNFFIKGNIVEELNILLVDFEKTQLEEILPCILPRIQDYIVKEKNPDEIRKYIRSVVPIIIGDIPLNEWRTKIFQAFKKSIPQM